MTMTVQRYTEIKKALELAQKAEMDARLQLVQQSGHVKIGSKTLAMDNYKVQVVNTVNTSVFAPMVDTVRKQLGDDKFNLVFVPKLSVSATGLKALTNEEREIAEEAITTSMGTPQFKIIKAPDSDEEATEEQDG